jgi:trehalose 6-phosphate phosphatase
MTGVPVPRPSWAYFLDLDGTLVEFASTPRRLRIDDALHDAISALSRSTHGAVALITGREIADIDRLFRGRRLAVAGQHGAERRGPGGHHLRHTLSPRHLDRARSRLAAIASAHPGLAVEDKGMSIALHYRRKPSLAGYAHRVMTSIVASLGPRFCLQTGNRVVEVRPSGVNKGSAILALMRDPVFRGRTPVFVGDDVTDEFGFAVVNRLGGYSVKVGRGRTKARWRLSSVAAVRGWLTSGCPLPSSVR